MSVPPSRTEIAKIGLALASAGIVATTLGCGGSTLDQRVTTALDLIPTSIRMAAQVGSLSELHRHVTIDSIEARHPELTRRVAGAIESQFGFDFLHLDALREAGFDPTRPIAIAVLSAPSGASVVVLPGDGARLGERLEQLHARRGASAKAVAEHHGTSVFDVDRHQTAWLPLPRHLVVVSGIQPPDQRRRVCLDILDSAGRDALTGDPDFVEARELLDAALDERVPDVWIYAPSISGANARSLETPVGDVALPALVAGPGDSHSGRLVAASFADTSAALTVVTRTHHPPVVTGSPDGTRAFLGRVPSEPLLFTHANVHVPSAWSAAAPNSGWRAAVTKEARRFLGAELGDLVPALGDGAGAIVNAVGLMGTDVVLYAGVDDTSALSAHLENLAARTAETPLTLPLGLRGSFESGIVAGVRVHRLSMKPFLDVVVGIVDDHVVLTTTAARFASIVNGDTSVLDAMPEPTAVRSLDSAQLILSMDADAVATQLGPLLALVPSLPAISGTEFEILSLFDHGAMWARSTDGAYVSHLRLSRRDPGLWPEIVDRALADLDR